MFSYSMSSISVIGFNLTTFSIILSTNFSNYVSNYVSTYDSINVSTYVIFCINLYVCRTIIISGASSSVSERDERSVGGDGQRRRRARTGRHGDGGHLRARGGRGR